ncbi:MULTISPECIES: tyrosine-type recombinase/integrase [Bacillus]|uniref:Tyr recombinase domain-containing protein n=2 Tax=Bacillaceae TaxID=186817 RepID=A0A9X6FQJ0_BACTU|nr:MULTISPECIES: site-specific integrase [Bacillus]KAA0776271.1 site-specific integrase [Bacillus sp. TE8-1]OTY98253.1 hypothetical protein BK754_07040 [Bacillus thuringiensis serovar subtoxicus]HCX51683.1 site-specific integrase [Bacillus sp. (in: firmicutes)]MDR4154148.1 site-specific integrase [Bacillus cereus]MDR4193854.1 site-specific integrase [Bacillus cereus]
MRNQMVIVLLISTGLRREELVNLKWPDIDMRNRTIMTYGKKRTVATIPYTQPHFPKSCGHSSVPIS